MIPLVCLLILGCGEHGTVDVSVEAEPEETDPAGEDDPPRDTGEPCAESLWGRDADGDGYAASGETVRACESPGEGWSNQLGDCDDTDPRKHGSEVCDPDDIDENCNGSAEEYDAQGQTTWYRDADGDGWGSSRDTKVSCDPPSGYLGTSGDCADDDPTRYPGAPEVCAYDGLDEDCDGSRGWFVDQDGDGHGGPNRVQTCDQPRAPGSGDCDDAEPALNPDAEEICADGIDQDCDGNAGPCGLEGVRYLSWHAPALAGGWADLGDLDGDGGLDILVRTTAGLAVHVAFDGSPRAEAEAALLAAPGPTGRSLAGGLWDVDGDGADDLVVREDTERLPGVWIEAGSKRGEARATTAEWAFPEAALAGAIDSDGDGAAEIALWTELGDADGSWEVAFVADLPHGTWSAADHARAWLGGDVETRDVGDTDGDGLPDLAWAAGGIHVANGPLGGEITADQEIGNLPDAIAYGVVGAGDLDGDGLADVAVSAAPPGARDHCGDPDPRTLFLDLAPFGGDLAASEAHLKTADLWIVASAGDLDGDAAPELLLDHQARCDTSPGDARILTGPYAGDVSGSVLGVIVAPAEVRSAFGADLDGDAIDDLLLSTQDYTWVLPGGPGL